jgi:hypothetical protein
MSLQMQAVVFASADFLASYPYWNASARGGVGEKPRHAMTVSISTLPQASTGWDRRCWVAKSLARCSELQRLILNSCGHYCPCSYVYNPVFELVYFGFALDIANEWRTHAGLPQVRVMTPDG